MGGNHTSTLSRRNGYRSWEDGIWPFQRPPPTTGLANAASNACPLSILRIFSVFVWYTGRGGQLISMMFGEGIHRTSDLGVRSHTCLTDDVDNPLFLWRFSLSDKSLIKNEHQLSLEKGRSNLEKRHRTFGGCCNIPPDIVKVLRMLFREEIIARSFSASSSTC